MQGYLSGSSEIHDESVVIIKCIDGKVTEVLPYNMNISLPNNYNDLRKLASNYLDK